MPCSPKKWGLAFHLIYHLYITSDLTMTIFRERELTAICNHMETDRWCSSFKGPAGSEPKVYCASLGEHSLESLQTSITTRRLQSTAHTKPPRLTQQNLHASCRVVLCEARTPPPARGAIISQSGQKVLSHLLCTSHSEGKPLALPQRSFPNSSAQRSCIAGPSWWTGIQ